MSPALGFCQSLQIFLCYSWSVYSSSPRSSHPHPPLSLPLLFSSLLFSHLITHLSLLVPLVPSWPLLSGEYRRGSPIFPGVPSLTGVPLQSVSPVGMFCEVSLLQGTSIPRGHSARPSQANGFHPGHVCMHAWDPERWRGLLDPSPCLGDSDLRPAARSPRLQMKLAENTVPQSKVSGTPHQSQSPIFCQIILSSSRKTQPEQ